MRAVIELGPIRVHVLRESTFWLDGGAMFGVVPRAVWEKTDPPDDRNRVALAANVAHGAGHGPAGAVARRSASHACRSMLLVNPLGALHHAATARSGGKG